MRVISIGSNDPKIFDEKSAPARRMAAYARVLGELCIVFTTTRREAFAPYTGDGFTVYGTNSFSRLLFPFDAARVAARIAGDVVTTQDPFEHGLAGVMAAHRLGVPLHVQLHTNPFAPAFASASYLNRLRLLIMLYVLRRAARIRVVSPRLMSEIERRYQPSAPITVLPIWADLARFRAVTRMPEHGLMVWVGRFESEKDPMLALETLAAARAAGTDARLVMLGKGSLQNAITARAKARGLAPYLELPGWVDSAPYLARAELALTTSWYEGYGLSIIEALAAGCPVFSTDVGVAREAGATIASSRAHYPKEAAELLKKGPPAPPPVSDPYPSFEAYVKAYADDIRATVRGS